MMFDVENGISNSTVKLIGEPGRSAELVSFLDHDLNATLKFDMFLVGDVINLLKYEIGSVNYTTTWNNLLIRIKSVRDSPSLIGYWKWNHIVDDVHPKMEVAAPCTTKRADSNVVNLYQHR